MIPAIRSKNYLQFFMNMHNVATDHSMGNVARLQGLTVISLSFSNAHTKLHFIILNMSNVITGDIFELMSIYAALNLSCIKNTNVEFGFMITC
jgi:hypothetical protein